MRPILFIISLIFANCVYAERNDTLICRQKVVDFYDWYSKAITQQKTSDIQPQFTEDSNGYTTLDFSTYVKNLKRFNFTDRLVNNEIAQYNQCLENLQKIKFKTFKESFEDLSDFENIKCDFFNTNRWIMSMETFTGIEISKTSINKTNCKVYGRIYEGAETNSRFYYGNVVVTLLKVNDIWMIDNIEL
jgi:hypothetical protein